jgi:hypothetical protein
MSEAPSVKARGNLLRRSSRLGYEGRVRAKASDSITVSNQGPFRFSESFLKNAENALKEGKRCSARAVPQEYSSRKLA